MPVNILSNLFQVNKYEQYQQVSKNINKYYNLVSVQGGDTEKERAGIESLYSQGSHLFSINTFTSVMSTLSSYDEVNT